MSLDQDKFLGDQFKESMSHLRHLEMLRAQHMAFFFTVLLASLGVMATLLKDKPFGDISADTKSFLIAWLLVLDALALFVLIGIKKLGHAHAIHTQIILRIHDAVFGATRFIEKAIGALGNQHPLSRSRLLSVQFANEAVVAVVVFALDGVVVAMLVASVQRHWFPWWQCAVLAAPMPCLLFFQAMLYRVIGLGRSHGVVIPASQSDRDSVRSNTLDNLEDG